ncbi:MAG TPA: ammonium transporter [Clostridia bacterium]
MKKSRKILGILFIIAIVVALFTTVAVAAAAATGDPSGVNYAANAVTGKETVGDVAQSAAKAQLGVNFVWVLITGFMVFFFQCGFAMVETGFCRGKNAAHTITMNFMVFLAGTIGYFISGFALQMGGAGSISLLGGTAPLNAEAAINGFGGLFGYHGFFLTTGGTYDAGIYALFFFQMVFMDTTVTIPTGSMAERVKYSATLITSFFIAMVFYPLYANWVWGGGWLSTLGSNFGLGHGAVDFAGSGVVHSMGGVLAVAGAVVIGPRIGKFKKDGTPRAFPGHHIPMAIVGTIILFFCWFSFNSGGTYSGSDFRIAIAATNTMIAGAVGGMVAIFYWWIKYGKPDPSMTANGALAGLVAITAPCGFTNALCSFIIGLIAGILVCIAVPTVENKFKIDDPVGAISVHFVNGLWGVIATGLFADGTYGDGLNGVKGNVAGLFYGDGKQFVAQLISVGVLLVYGLGVAFLWYKLLDKVWGLRVSPEVELAGLDIDEMGAYGYPDFQINKSNELDFSSTDNAEIKQLKNIKYRFRCNGL